MADNDLEKLYEKTRAGGLPLHAAVIMDGNGRWAAQRKISRIRGHMAGAASIRRVIMAARRLGVRYLTLYAFSTENWKRPKSEVSSLFSLMSRFLKKETRSMQENDIRLVTIGDISKIPPGPRKELLASIEKTSGGSSLTVAVALNYGARQEIARAFNALAEKRKGRDAEDISPEDIEACLDTAGIPDPDLMIRTSGEMRLSNFLLWQISYSELYFTETLWPDFHEEAFCEAILEFQKRKRRFGGL